MKKLIAIALLFSFVNSITELHECIKLPHFISHFIEHNQESSNISLTEYINVHYVDGQENRSDENHDNGCLPLQGGHACQSLCVCIFYVDHPPQFNLSIQPKSTETSSIYIESAISNYHATIWQPPKIG